MLSMAGQFDIGRGELLIPELVLAGEWWRLVTFLFIPPVTNVIFAFFAWYLFNLMGSALEGRWGAFRYNLFLLVGYLVTVAVASSSPAALQRTCSSAARSFLALLLYPDFVLYILSFCP